MRSIALCFFSGLLATLLPSCESTGPAPVEPESSNVLTEQLDAYLPVDDGRSYEEPWLVLQLRGDRRVFVGQEMVFDGMQHTDEQLVARLAQLRDAALAEGRCHLGDRQTRLGTHRVILEPVVLRGDVGVMYEDVARVHDCCLHPSLQIDNVVFAGGSDGGHRRDTPVPSEPAPALEDLILPGFPDPAPEEPWLVLHVSREGSVLIDGRREFVHATGTDEQLRALLARLRADALAAGRCHLEPRSTRDGVVEVVVEPLLIRSEKNAEWQLVERIMKCCKQPQLGIWKLRLALTAEDG